ncbi:MAG: hypothetical protein ACRC9V_09410 [Aeromonas sp.]
MSGLSLTQFAARLPSVILTQLLLALLLICNLTLCISGYVSSPSPPSVQDSLPWHITTPIAHGAMTPPEIAKPMIMDHHATLPACHQNSTDNGVLSSDCHMPTGVLGATSALPLLGLLISLCLFSRLPLSSMGAASLRLIHMLRDPFLCSRGASLPSWPRRHLMLLVLRH